MLETTGRVDECGRQLGDVCAGEGEGTAHAGGGTITSKANVRQVYF